MVTSNSPVCSPDVTSIVTVGFVTSTCNSMRLGGSVVVVGILAHVSRHLNCQRACACGGDSGGVGCATPRQRCSGSNTSQRDVPRRKAGHRLTEGDGHRKRPVCIVDGTLVISTLGPVSSGRFTLTVFCSAANVRFLKVG